MYDNDEIDFRPTKQDVYFRRYEETKKDEGKKLPNITLYIDSDIQDILRRIAKKENRSMSKQVIHMMEYYIEHNNIDPKEI